MRGCSGSNYLGKTTPHSRNIKWTVTVILRGNDDGRGLLALLSPAKHLQRCFLNAECNPLSDPSSGLSGHLLPQGEKGGQETRTVRFS